MGAATATSRRPWNFVRYHPRALIRLTVFASARASLQYTPFGILKYMVGGSRAARPEFGVVDHGIDSYARIGLGKVSSSS